jgi:hypothetical protein
MAEDWAVAISEQRSPPPAQPRVRSEYSADPPRIVLYRDAIDALHAALRTDPSCTTTRRDLEEVHIAHELFHHLEADGRVASLPRDESERAAQAFAHELLSIPSDPRDLSPSA